MLVFLSRKYKPRQTTGSMSICDGDKLVYHCNTLEPQYNFNKNNNSCIYEGDYIVEKHLSPTFGRCFKVTSVIGRSHILWHKGNFRRDTEGCILVGSGFKDIDNDGLKDVLNSTEVFDKLLAILPEKFLMCIRSDQDYR